MDLHNNEIENIPNQIFNQTLNFDSVSFVSLVHSLRALFTKPSRE